MIVAALWRYPVKSLRGEPLETAAIEPRGVAGDRAWAFVDADGTLASGKDGRRFRRVPGLMMHASRYDGDVPVLELAGGRSVRADDPAIDDAVARLAGPSWRLATGGDYFDGAPIHLVTTSTLARVSEAAHGTVEPARLRPNIVLDTGDAAGFPEDGWIGRTLAIGDVRLRVVERTERCVMTTQAQDGLPRRPAVLKAIGRANEACAGVYAEVVAAGTAAVGAPARLV